MWKVSKYLYIWKEKEKAVLYCTHNGCIINLTSNEAKIVEYLQDKEFEQSEVKEDIFQELVKNGIIVPADKDETLEILKAHKSAIENSDKLHLTLFITDECNFNCYYCFVDKSKRKYMDEATWDKVKLFIEKRVCGYKGLSISWFGGEPLERKIELCKYSNQLRDLCWEKGISYYAKIVTNGYDLTKDIFQELYFAGINSFQITFDGYQTYHDTIRVHERYGKTFDRIITNLKEIKKLEYEDIGVLIRCNMVNDVDNEIEKFIKLYQKEFEKDKRFGLQVKPIVNYGSNIKSELLLTYINKISMLSGLASKYEVLDSVLIDKFYPRRIWCSTLNPHAFVVAPDGKVFTCDSTVNNQEYYYGVITHDGAFEENPKFDKSYFEQKQGEACLQCKKFPICFGTCQYIYHKVKKHACALSDKDIQVFLQYIISKQERS